MDRLFRRMLWSCVVGASGLQSLATAEERRPPYPTPRASAEARVAALESELAALLQKLRAPDYDGTADVEPAEILPVGGIESPLPRATPIPADATRDVLDFEDPFGDEVVPTQHRQTVRPAPNPGPVPAAPQAFEPLPPEKPVPVRTPAPAAAPLSPQAERLRKIEQEIDALKSARDEVAAEAPEATGESSDPFADDVPPKRREVRNVVTGVPTPAPPAAASELPVEINPRPTAPRVSQRPAVERQTSRQPAAQPVVENPSSAATGEPPIDPLLSRVRRLESELEDLKRSHNPKSVLPETDAPEPKTPHTPAPAPVTAQPAATPAPISESDPFESEDVLSTAEETEGTNRAAEPIRGDSRPEAHPLPRATQPAVRQAARPPVTDPFADDEMPRRPTPSLKRGVPVPAVPTSAHAAESPVAVPHEVLREEGSLVNGQATPRSTELHLRRATRPNPAVGLPPAAGQSTRPAPANVVKPLPRTTIAVRQPAGTSTPTVHRNIPTRRIVAGRAEFAPPPPSPRLDSSVNGERAPEARPAASPSRDAAPIDADESAVVPAQQTENAAKSDVSDSDLPKDAAVEGSVPDDAYFGTGRITDADWLARRERLIEEIRRARQSTAAEGLQEAARPDVSGRGKAETIVAPVIESKPTAKPRINPNGATAAPAPPEDPPPEIRSPQKNQDTDPLGPSTTTPPAAPTTSPNALPESSPQSPNPPSNLNTAATASSMPRTAPRRAARPSGRGGSSRGSLFGSQGIDDVFQLGDSNVTFYAGYDLLVLQPRFENSEGLIVDSGTTSSKNFDFDYELSPRAVAGLVFDGGFGVRFQGWQFDHGTRISQTDAVGGLVRTPRITPSNTLVPIVLTTAAANDTLRAEHSLQFQSYDLEGTWQQRFRESAVTITGGVRYLQMDQRFDVQRVTGAGVIDRTLRHDHDFEGVGPTIAAEWNWPFGDSALSVYAGGRGSVVFGSRSQSTTLKDAAGTLARELNIDQAAHVGIGEAGLGLQYSSNGLTLRAGYEGQVWTDVGSATSRNGNMGLQGFSASLGFSY